MADEHKEDYLNETVVKEFMCKVAAMFQINGTSGDPLFVTATTYLALREFGLEPEIVVGYLWKSDAPAVLLNWPWIQTRSSDGRIDVTDVTQFPDNSKSMSILGLIMSPPGSFKCVYYTHKPDSIQVPGSTDTVPLTVLTDGVPSVSEIRRTLDNLADYMFQRNKRVPNSTEQIQDIVDNAKRTFSKCS